MAESRTDGTYVMVLTEESSPRVSTGDNELSAPLLTKDVGSVSALALTMNLVNASLGSGALSLPWAAAGASMLAGVGITLLVLVLNALSNIILVVAAERLQVFDLGGVLGHLPGPWGRSLRLFFDASIWFSVGLTLVGYLVVVADALESWHLPKTYGLALGAAVALPLSFLEPKYLAFSSSLSVGANVYLVGLIAVLFSYKREEPPVEFCLVGYGPGLITMCSALMQSLIFQMCMLPMYETLKDRSVKRFSACLLSSFVFVFLLFAALCFMSLSLYGSNVSSNILQNLPQTPWGNFGRIAMGLSVLAVYPIYLESMVAPLRHAEARALRHHKPLQLPSPASSTGFDECDASREPSCNSLPLRRLSSAHLERIKMRVLGFRLWTPLRPSQLAVPLVVGASALGGTVAPHLGACNIMNGASQVAAMVGWAPGFTGLFLLDRPSAQLGLCWRGLMLLLIVFSTLMSVLGLLYTDNFIKELHRMYFTQA